MNLPVGCCYCSDLYIMELHALLTCFNLWYPAATSITNERKYKHIAFSSVLRKKRFIEFYSCQNLDEKFPLQRETLDLDPTDNSFLTNPDKKQRFRLFCELFWGILGFCELFWGVLGSVECTSPVTERVPIFTDIQKESKIVSVWTIFYVILNLCALSAMVWRKMRVKNVE